MNPTSDYPEANIVDYDKKIILHKVHPHELYFATLKPGYRCDICKDYPIKTSYKCVKCDFDYCTKCYENKNIPAELPALFEHEPIACDFYKKTIMTRIDDSYYHQMLDMLFKQIAKQERVIWCLTIQDECSTRMILPIDSCHAECKCATGDCNNCKTIMHCKECDLTIRIERGKPINIKCDYDAPTDKPLYMVKPEELREKYWSEKYDAVKKHVNEVLHHFYIGDVMMTLEGVYLA